MREGKYMRMIMGVVLSVSLMTAALAAMLVSFCDSRRSFEVLDCILGEVVEQEPEAENLLAGALKKYTEKNGDHRVQSSILLRMGYQAADFRFTSEREGIFLAAGTGLAGSLLFAGTFWYRNQKEKRRIQLLAEYLEQVNTGKAVILSASGEDEFSRLEDEIYKTVTFLYQTRDEAVQAKNGFAQNLSNIAHQIKTPITAISLSLQTMEKEKSGNDFGQIQKQLLRLTRLEEAMLVLSRLDAGTLPLKQEKIDVFTVLVLAVDNLQELLTEAGVEVRIPELGEMAVTADLDWTMEAVMNLLKNCMEHNPGGIIHCTYGQNPLYTEILIWDEGRGFEKEDIPHLFERFYRGKNAGAGGIGIGLALSKEIIERQNGTIQAENRPEGGACFEIRFYSH